MVKEAEPQTDLGLRILVFKMADYFKADNPNFKHEVFYKACGLDDSQYKHIEEA
jgi:5-hydroxyisourate hydrolase-like protein (transthyretin family)